ncbi:hypothetical protein RFI_06413 [Reticulomyxa filosa]|uniref:Microbial-type PARG catalytic domain-containing protein n=1 Tax=Reticulomyxa filosa TaxID=46433 RepID=X6NZI3_RETFI|nr:hypothetical protein RFI_06413 [Reticulomyxa filosa]|eukprot:ETO30702.1 hypothetical protein RFI_06413 [Reticulomyxa filosa]
MTEKEFSCDASTITSETTQNIVMYQKSLFRQIVQAPNQVQSIRKELEKLPHNSTLWKECLSELMKLANASKQTKAKYSKSFHNLRILIQSQTNAIVRAEKYVLDDGITTIYLNKKNEFEIIANAAVIFAESKEQDATTNKSSFVSKKEDHIKATEPITLDEEKREEVSTLASIIKKGEQIKIKRADKKTRIFTTNMDCLDVCEILYKKGLNPICLNMANERTPGGGWKSGSGAQEENLFRRSLYQVSLIDNVHTKKKQENTLKKYPIPEFGCIYSPNVTVFRHNEESGYKLCSTPFPVSFIAAAMYHKPALNPKTLQISSKQVARNIQRKFKTVLQCALHFQHKAVVLGAWGCGAYSCPPQHLALLFNQVLCEDHGLRNAFDVICFAILNDHNCGKVHNPNGNYAPFAQIFGEDDNFLKN